jgi:hypothetical protein
MENQCDYTDYYVTNGTAQILAGPQLDQMQPLAGTAHIGSNGRFSGSQPPVAPFASLGQTIYYCVDATYTCPADDGGATYVQPSAVLAYLVTSTASGFGPPPPVTQCVGLQFPVYSEWPTPVFFPPYASTSPYVVLTNQILAPGEEATFTIQLFDDILNIPPSVVQWRKDGRNIPGATNVVTHGYFAPTTSITITNVQPEDAGVYDIFAQGIYQPAISFELYLNVQVINGPGVLQSPRTAGPAFLANLVGIPGRQYDVQWSTNLSDWYDLLTVTNLTGTVTVSNSLATGSAQFYRTKLLPYSYYQ